MPAIIPATKFMLEESSVASSKAFLIYLFLYYIFIKQLQVLLAERGG